MSDGDFGKLRTNEPGKEAAAKALAGDIQPGTDVAATKADEANGKAVSDLRGWATGAGLKDVQDEWGRQVKALQGRLAADRSALQQALKGFIGYEHRTASILDRFQIETNRGEK
ncbi:hypothetical protein I5Q34_00650 [Streptomyces sp. AV19]|uniref:hypothetical protein n=1 Tax=Streptomyces sp. AV19 TaxID=2793068 RepID=UPI0018FE23A5|nr:hypothetical protein [Streptomyces sp. AV19]MBH1932817.1 hypothetical protein [Streptomyces sp. AV19]MDG4531482.1 hypothetical protein [Streptomyces sp. AV19]